MIAYKLFKLKKDGKLYPLFVDTQNCVPMNVWIQAKPGTKTVNGKVKSKLGELAYRPGFHSTMIPLADHIGKKQPDGSLCQAKNTIWCEVEIVDNDYTSMVREGVKNIRDACMKKVPYGCFYFYKTNPKAKVDWVISGEILVRRILTNDDVAKICRDNGFEPQPVEQ